jgi:hypothetical protein
MTIHPVRLTRFERALGNSTGNEERPVMDVNVMNRETATRYLTAKIAKIIHDTVACELRDRSESDWLSAERIVKKHFSWFIDRVIGLVDTQLAWSLPENCSYERLREKAWTRYLD